MFAPGPSRQVAAAPPMYAINSRRLTSFPKPKDDTLTSAEAVVHHSKFGRSMSEMGLGCAKTRRHERTRQPESWAPCRRGLPYVPSRSLFLRPLEHLSFAQVRPSGGHDCP